jgi:hypothetical protein
MVGYNGDVPSSPRCKPGDETRLKFPAPQRHGWRIEFTIMNGKGQATFKGTYNTGTRKGEFHLTELVLHEPADVRALPGVVTNDTFAKLETKAFNEFMNSPVGKGYPTTYGEESGPPAC